MAGRAWATMPADPGEPREARDDEQIDAPNEPPHLAAEPGDLLVDAIEVLIDGREAVVDGRKALGHAPSQVVDVLLDAAEDVADRIEGVLLDGRCRASPLKLTLLWTWGMVSHQGTCQRVTPEPSKNFSR
jgi:hypothetical protein